MADAHEIIERARSLAVTKEEHSAVEHHAKYLTNAIHNMWLNDERREREWFVGWLKRKEMGS